MTAILAASLLVFLVNAMPAFMPPTWSILAVLHLAYDIPVVPLAIGVAFAATGGRLALALAARRYGRRLLRADRRMRLARVGAWLDDHARWSAPAAVLLYSFGPIPSNQLFIAAGLTETTLRRIVAAFLAGRLVSYPLWIAAAEAATDRLETLFAGRLTNVTAVVLELSLIALLVAFTRIDWDRFIRPAFADPKIATFGPSAGDRADTASRP